MYSSVIRRFQSISGCTPPRIHHFSTMAATNKNMVEKIVGRYVIHSKSVKAGEFVSIKPAYVMTHDNTSAVMSKFFSIGTGVSINNPRQIVITLDHNVQDKTPQNLEKYKKIQLFAEKNNIDFYPAGRGIGHQIMCEEGYAFPGTLVVASDSHSNMYGGLGCLGTPIVRTDAAGIWVTGKTWWKVPPVTKVTLSGQLVPGVTGKDIIITLCGNFNKDEVLNNAVEFHGPGIENIPIDDRLTIANMSTEWGALAGIFPIDGKTLEWIRNRMKYYQKKGIDHPRFTEENISSLQKNYHQYNADDSAYYHQEITLDLNSVRPHVSGPNHVKVMKPILEIEKEKKKISKAYIVSCVNSRVQDLAAAADVLRGKKIADHVKFYIAAASSQVEEESQLKGDWQTLLSSGAQPLPPGCGPCIGLGTGLLEDGEVGISATNRNFKGRMGSRNAECYLASPAIVAASALKGYISAPESISEKPTNLRATLSRNSPPATTPEKVDLLDGFPKYIEGEAVFCPQDNINTDGIYPGKYTYREDVTPEQQAEVVMENYDPEFRKIVRKGDIVIGKYNFGTGSSREQAVTAFKYKGISLLLAGSFSETYMRNAYNNGFICIEVPDLVKDFTERYHVDQRPTIRTGSVVQVNFGNSTISANGKEYSISPIGPAVQELILAGGLEAWITKQIQNELTN